MSKNRGQESDEDDEYWDPLTDIGDPKETQIDVKDPIDFISEITNSISTDLDSDEDDKHWDPLTGINDANETQIDERDPKDSVPEMTDNDTTYLKSDEDGEYWDPLTDTYKNKKANKGDPDDEDFLECPIK